MRPARIEIPDVSACTSKARRFLNRFDRQAVSATPSARKSSPYVFRGASGQELSRPGVQGIACVYRKPFGYEGEIVFFDQGAFSAAEFTRDVELLFDHREGRAYGSTRGGLIMAQSLSGLAFRLPLEGDDGRTVHENVMSQMRANVSVGCQFEKTEMQTIAGQKVRVIKSARLKEISLCKQGKVPETAAWVVDLKDEEPNLWLACRKSSFVAAKAVANVISSGQRIIDTLQREVGK